MEVDEQDNQGDQATPTTGAGDARKPERPKQVSGFIVYSVILTLWGTSREKRCPHFRSDFDLKHIGTSLRKCPEYSLIESSSVYFVYIL